MDDDQLLDLIGLVMAHDHRKYDPAEVDLWGKHARLADWTLPEAKDAVMAFYHAREVRDFSDWIKPGDVTVWINQRRRNGRSVGEPRPFAALALDRSQPASDEHQAACMAEIRAVLSKSDAPFSPPVATGNDERTVDA